KRGTGQTILWVEETQNQSDDDIAFGRAVDTVSANGQQARSASTALLVEPIFPQEA
ncbi:hypothetical protein NQZ68_032120, partial [Dissostichus eleginoides]